LVRPFHTSVAFGDFARGGIKLGDSKGTGYGTSLATDAQFFVRKDNSIFSLLHSSRGAGQNTCRSVTVETCSYLKIHNQLAILFHRPKLNHFYGVSARRQIMLHFTGRLTAVASCAKVGFHQQGIALDFVPFLFLTH
jgi:hypothetical protein